MDSVNQVQVPIRRSRLRRPLAVLLGLLCPGLGSTVMGNPKRGLKWLVVTFLAFFLAITGMVTGHSQVAWFGLILIAVARLAEMIDTLRIPAPLNPPSTRVLFLIGVAMFLSVDIGLSAAPRLAQARRVIGYAMYPTLHDGDHFFVARVWTALDRGDVIAMSHPFDPDIEMVTRILGVPGDWIEIRDRRLIFNGEPAATQATVDDCEIDGNECVLWREMLGGKTYSVALANGPFSVTRDYGPGVIPDGYLFVLNDNRAIIDDSRPWGLVPVDLVRGKLRFIYYSWSESGMRWSRINMGIE